MNDGRRFRVSFEMVSAIAFPELYAGDRPRPDVDRVSLHDNYWHPVSRETSDERDARQQYVGLLNLIMQGELIRNAKLEVTRTMVQWEPFHVNDVSEEEK